MTIDEFEGQWRDGGEFVTAHTSGSTGTPKEIRLPKADMRASASATNAFFSLGAGAVYGVPLSFDYIAARMQAVRAWQGGGRVAVIAPSNTFAMPAGRIDLLAVVPSQCPWLAAHPEWAERVGDVIVGGAPLDSATARALVGAGYRPWQTYGMTETCSHVALRPLESKEYTALPGVTFSTDARGCLVVDIPYMTIGRVVTNDIVELVSPTRFVWLGRADNVINSGGIKIMPEELEARIRALVPDLDFDFYVTGRPDSRWGTAVTLVGEADADSLAALAGRLDALLPHTHLPKRYESLIPLPRTPNGKLRRL